ncbi:MAG: hypothetical protein KBG15_01140 [Kofleriaceae bacterium]|nr:hypothetical protein [Kofleriaceae bacterium]
MRRLPLRTAMFALCAVAACRTTTTVGLAAWPSGDLPVDLAEINDLDAAVDAMWAAPPSQRAAARAPIVAELLRQLQAHTAAAQGGNAAITLFQIATLWSEELPAFASEFAHGLAPLRATKRLLAQSGDMPATILALAMLGQLEPAMAGTYRAEISEILDYADQSAVAESGELAQRSRALLVLEPVVRGFPNAELSETWVTRMIERQGFVEAMLNSQRASFELVRAHSGVLTTARRIATTMARAGQGKHAARRIAPLTGIGSDRELARLAAGYAAAAATDTEMTAFADALATGGKDGRDADPVAALALCRNSGAAERCAFFADAAGRLEQPLAWLGNVAPSGATAVDSAGANRAQLRANLRAQQISRLALLGRPIAAAQALREFAATAPSPELLASVQIAVGRGLLSIGETSRGETLLRRGLTLDPTNTDAAEALAGVELHRGHGKAALVLVQAALRHLDDARLTNYPRAKLLALAGDAGRIAQLDRDQTVRWYQDSLLAWTALAEGGKVPARLLAESALAMGKARWFLGDIEPAITLIVEAGDRDPADATIASQSLAFLLLANRPHEALDVFLRAVREHGVSEEHRTMMALWMQLDAQQRGHTVDPTVARVLRVAAKANRRWHERLAAHIAQRAATDTAMADVATSRQRGAELTFYRATLMGPLDLAALRRVVDAGLPSLRETDFANALLGQNPLSVQIAPAHRGSAR